MSVSGRKKEIGVGTLDWGPEERGAVKNLIDQEDPFLTMGPLTAQFEKEFAAWLGVKRAIAVNSGSSALLVAMRAMKNILGGPSYGSPFYDSYHVRCPALTYQASWHVIENSGLYPAYYDVGYDFQTNRDLLPKHGFIETVHLFGKPCMDPQWLENPDIRFLEDACQALGSRWLGKRLGSFGMASAFSFFPAHQLTTIEGGMVATNNDEVADLCVCLRDNGRPRPYPSNYWESRIAGYNMKFTDLQAAIGLVKMRKIDRIVERRNTIFRRYANEIGPFREEPGEYICPLMYPIYAKIGLRDTVITKLKEKGIFGRPSYLHRGINPMAKHLSETTLQIPSHHNLTDEDVDYVIESVLALKEMLVLEEP